MSTVPKNAESRMRKTGKHALAALGVGVVLTVLLALLMGAVSLLDDFLNGEPISLQGAVFQAREGLITAGLCVIPVVFLLTFALLQRIRIK